MCPADSAVKAVEALVAVVARREVISRPCKISPQNLSISIDSCGSGHKGAAHAAAAAFGRKRVHFAQIDAQGRKNGNVQDGEEGST